MVIYFKSTVVSPPAVIFMGVDKFENEDLIKWGWPEDVWFHVDKVSSAHVYLRLQPNQTLDDVPSSVLEDCAQLVKANSIQGAVSNVPSTTLAASGWGSFCSAFSEVHFAFMSLASFGNKMNNLDVVYTMWANLKKTQGMEVGQVGFHKQREVRTIRVEKRVNEIVNRLMKTKEERQPDLRAEREERDQKEREDKKQILREQKEREKQEQKEKEELAKLRSYDTLMKEDNMKSNKEDGYDSDDFM